jgi:hypothetical protein
MNQRTCSFKSALAAFKLAVMLIFSVNHSGLSQYKSNAPFAALIRHADSSNAADLNKRLISIPEYDKAFEAYFKDKNPRITGVILPKTELSKAPKRFIRLIKTRLNLSVQKARLPTGPP